MYPSGLSPCPFCSIARDRILLDSAAAIAVPDAYPVSEGHTLVLPRRHLASIYDLAEAEQSELWSLVRIVRDRLAAEHNPDGFNIGLNDGLAAGQTVAHAHIHVIPRRHGDVADPRGGVRWVLPHKAAYWSK